VIFAEENGDIPIPITLSASWISVLPQERKPEQKIILHFSIKVESHGLSSAPSSLTQVIEVGVTAKVTSGSVVIPTEVPPSDK
jgi:hypothetical protein